MKEKMKKVLVVVDMQEDFIGGALGTIEAQAIVPNVVEKINKRNKEGYLIVATMDSHDEGYLATQEGKNLPVVHCLVGSDGWQINEEIYDAMLVDTHFLLKETFGSDALPSVLLSKCEDDEIEEIELIGVCTDICVISNAMILKAFFPEAKIKVDASCCAGVTQKSHKNALEAMKMCQIEIIGE